MFSDDGFTASSYRPVKLEKLLLRVSIPSIPRGQVTLYKALYEAGDEFAPSEDLVERIPWGDPKQKGV